MSLVNCYRNIMKLIILHQIYPESDKFQSVIFCILFSILAIFASFIPGKKIFGLVQFPPWPRFVYLFFAACGLYGAAATYYGWFPYDK